VVQRVAFGSFFPQNDPGMGGLLLEGKISLIRYCLLGFILEAWEASQQMLRSWYYPCYGVAGGMNLCPGVTQQGLGQPSPKAATDVVIRELREGRGCWCRAGFGRAGRSDLLGCVCPDSCRSAGTAREPCPVLRRAGTWSGANSLFCYHATALDTRFLQRTEPLL